MSRSVLAASLAAVALATVAISAGVGGSSVGTAEAARPFSVSKSQFTTVRKVSTLALKTSRANTKAIAALQPQVTTAGVPGPKGDPGAPGGFDPTKVTRVTGDNEVLNPLAAYNATTVTCPSPSIAIGGGWFLAAGAENGEFHVSRSYPSPTLSSWSLRFRYTGAAAVNMTPYAICAGA